MVGQAQLGLWCGVPSKPLTGRPTEGGSVPMTFTLMRSTGETCILIFMFLFLRTL